jgi:uncharacterized membrane protein
MDYLCFLSFMGEHNAHTRQCTVRAKLQHMNLRSIAVRQFIAPRERVSLIPDAVPLPDKASVFSVESKEKINRESALLFLRQSLTS